MSELDWHWLTLSQACQRLKSGQGSALELTRDMLRRANAWRNKHIAMCICWKKMPWQRPSSWTTNRPLANPWGCCMAYPSVSRICCLLAVCLRRPARRL